MPLVSNSGQDDEERSNRAEAGGPPNFSHIHFDPKDPDAVKVHYDVSGWSFDQRAELSEVLAEMSMPHAWDDDELVVPEEVEAPMDAVFSALEAELGPFPVLLDDDVASVAYELDEWPPLDIESLRAILLDEQRPHRWEGRTLVVAVDDESEVDSMLDQIEADAVAAAGPPPAPDKAMHELSTIANRLAKNPAHSKAREKLFALVPHIETSGPPFGLEAHEWTPARDLALELQQAFEADDVDTERIELLASRLVDATLAWV